MNRKRVRRVLVAIFCVAVLISVPLNNQAGKARSIKGQYGIGEQILKASIQINMSIVLSPSSTSQDSQKMNSNKVIANGIGSLIEEDGEVFIITHNHWGVQLQRTSLIEFRDAKNDLLLRMFGFQFQDLIRHQDKGTLILEVPDEMAAFLSVEIGASNAEHSLFPRQPGNTRRVKSGDIVEVVHRKGDHRDEIGAMEAVVESVDQFKGLPIFWLRSLNGQPILHGDSGGGVWFNGKLVGNMWATVVLDSQPIANQSSGNSVESSTVFSDISFAAILDINAIQN